MKTRALLAAALIWPAAARANGPVASVPTAAPSTIRTVRTVPEVSAAFIPAAPGAGLTEAVRNWQASRGPGAAIDAAAVAAALPEVLARAQLSEEAFLALPESERVRHLEQAAQDLEARPAIAHEPPALETIAAKPEVGRAAAKVAAALLGVLEDTQDSDSRPAVYKRIDDLIWKNYGDDEIGKTVVTGLAAQITDESDSDDVKRMGDTIDGIVGRAKSPDVVKAGISALAKAAAQVESDDDGQPLLLRVEAAALASEDMDVRRHAIGVLRAQRGDFEDTNYGAALLDVIANIRDSFQEAAADKNDPGVAVSLVLGQSLAKAGDQEDAARIVARIAKTAEEYPYEAAQRVLARALLRALRDPDLDSEAAEAATGALRSMAAQGSQRVKRAVEVGLKRLAKDDESSFQTEAQEALDHLNDPASSARASVPSPDADGAAGARPEGAWRRIAIPGAAALLALFVLYWLW